MGSLSKLVTAVLVVGLGLAACAKPRPVAPFRAPAGPRFDLVITVSPNCMPEDPGVAHVRAGAPVRILVVSECGVSQAVSLTDFTTETIADHPFDQSPANTQCTPAAKGSCRITLTVRQRKPNVPNGGNRKVFVYKYTIRVGSNALDPEIIIEWES